MLKRSPPAFDADAGDFLCSFPFLSKPPQLCRNRFFRPSVLRHLYSRLNLSDFSSPFVLPSRNHAFYSPFFFSKAAPNYTMSVPFSPISGEFPLTSNFVRLKRTAKDDLHLPPKPLPDSKSIFPNKSRHPFAYAMRQFPNPLPIRLLSAPTQRTPDFSAKDNIHSKDPGFS